jgi:ubiquitin-protein ligase
MCCLKLTYLIINKTQKMYSRQQSLMITKGTQELLLSTFEWLEDVNIIIHPNKKLGLKLTLKSPIDGLYSGKTFHITIEISNDYPFRSPIIRFQDDIYHPNVTYSGRFEIKDWSPIISFTQIAMNLYLLFDDVDIGPNACISNNLAKNRYLQNINNFKIVAKYNHHWNKVRWFYMFFHNDINLGLCSDIRNHITQLLVELC